MLADSSGTAALSPLVIAAVVGIVVAAVVSVVAAVPRVHPVQENAKDPALDRVDLLGRAPRRLRRRLAPPGRGGGDDDRLAGPIEARELDVGPERPVRLGSGGLGRRLRHESGGRPGPGLWLAGASHLSASTRTRGRRRSRAGRATARRPPVT